jgi:Zn-finger nucleic acid-binding protein
MTADPKGMAGPIDDAQLVMTERQGIEIDYCPNCRGVWLDRGELDKIIERSAAEMPCGAPVPQPYPSRDHDRYQRPQKRRKSFLEELFD